MIKKKVAAKRRGFEFRSAKHMLAWVRSHPLGEWLRAKIVNDAYAAIIEDRQPVVVELFSDGGVQVYAGKRVDVRVVQRPHSPLPQAAEKLDEYVAGLLPVKHKRVYGAGGALRAVGRCEKIKPSDIMSRRKMLDCLSRLDEIGARFNGKR